MPDECTHLSTMNNNAEVVHACEDKDKTACETSSQQCKWNFHEEPSDERNKCTHKHDHNKHEVKVKKCKTLEKFDCEKDHECKWNFY